MLIKETTAAFGVLLPLLLFGAGAHSVFKSDFEARHGAVTQDSDDEAEEGDVPIAVSQLPQAVAKAATPYFRSLDACKASREEEAGIVVFEVEGVGPQGGDLSLKLTGEGIVLEVERKLSPEALPAAARNAIAARFPGAGTESTEAVELHFYELKLLVKGEKVEVKVAADGSFLEEPTVKGKQAKKDKKGEKKERDEDEDEHEDED